MTAPADDGYRVRVSMTFSENAHPAFVQTLRGLSSRGRSRMIHALVERGLSLGIAAGAGTSPPGNGRQLKVGWLTADNPVSPLDALGSPGSLAGAEEMGP